MCGKSHDIEDCTLRNMFWVLPKKYQGCTMQTIAPTEKFVRFVAASTNNIAWVGFEER